MQHKKWMMWLLAAMMAILMTACGGDDAVRNPAPGSDDVHAPVVSIDQRGGTVFTTETVSLSAKASDPDGDSLTYVWSLDSKPEGSRTELQTPLSLNSSFVPDVAGEYKVSFYAYDGANRSVATSIIFLAVVRGECVELGWKIIDKDTTFDQPCYRTKHITVEAGATLTIDPGSTVIFEEDTYNNLTIDGTLKAVGTEEKVITFTSEEKTDGAWEGIFIESASNNQLEHVVIEYANQGISFLGSGDKQVLSLKNSLITHSKKHGMWIANKADFEMDNVTFTHNEIPVYIYAQFLPMLKGTNHYKDNTDNYVYVHADSSTSGIIDEDSTWHKLSIPYRLVGYSVNVEHNTTLTIEPGVTVEVANKIGFIVAGTLVSEGTADEPIVFTASQSLKESGQTWKGISLKHNEYFHDIQHHRLEHTTVEYADCGLSLEGDEHTSINITDTVFQHNETAGFVLAGNDMNLTFKSVTSTKNNRPGEVYPYMLSTIDDTSDFTGNTIDLLWATMFSIDTNQIWNKQTVPVFINNIAVENGATLTIAEGSTIAISTGGLSSVWRSETASSTLIARGTVEKPITFIGAALSATGYEESAWYGLAIYGDVEMEHVVVKKAGGDLPDGGSTEAAVIVNDNGSLTVTDSSFEDSGKHAIYVTCHGVLTQSGNRFLRSGDADIKYQTGCD